MQASRAPAGTRVRRIAALPACEGNDVATDMAFGPLCQRFYDADHGFADSYEVSWYVARLPQDAGAVLEAMCGSGRLLVPLLQAGINVHGVDESAAMLAACEARATRARCATTLLRQRLDTLNLPFRYAAAFIAAGALQLLVDAAERRRALQRLRAHLVPPALLLLELHVPAIALAAPGAPLVEVRAVRPPDGSRITLHSETRVDTETRLIERKHRYEQREAGGELRREDEMLRETWIDEDEIEPILHAAGYGDITVLPAPCRRGARSFAVSARAL